MTCSSARRLAVVAALSMLPLGCATTSTSGVFKSYTASFATARESAAAGSLLGVDGVYGPDAARSDGKGLLANLELGGFYQAFGDFGGSATCLGKADAIAREIESRAVISARAVGRNIGSAFTNDSALEFRGDAYEKVMARSLNALNYLLLGDSSSARIEIRKAAEYQDLELARHREELRELQEESAEEQEERRRGDMAIESSTEMRSAIDEMSSYTRDFENSYLNPFTYFLSGLTYELNGEMDDAFLDYRRAYELWPSSRAAARSLAISAKLTSREEEVASLSPPLDPSLLSDLDVAKDATVGRVVVIYGQGLVPQKQEVKFPFPVPGGELAWAAFATYTDYSPPPGRLRVSSAGGMATETEPIVNLRALAVKALQEKWKATAARQVARAVTKTTAKIAARREAQRQAGPLGGLLVGLAGDIYQAASERADLRAWYSLPDQVQVATLFVPSGEQQIRLDQPTGTGSVTIQVPVSAGKTTVIFARSLGARFGAWSQGSADGGSRGTN